ncbi:MAG: histidine kinase [Opitutae bacterium]|nr:histidine kinase [Opitutae bacterium]
MNRAPADTAAKLERAKCRLYVAAQVGGWGAFLLFQFGVATTFGDPSKATRDSTTESAIYCMIALLGLALTHYARRFMESWGWKSMNWRALTPRVIGMAAVLAFLWCAVGYGYSYGIVGLPWPSKFNPVAVFFFSWINSLVVMFGWLSAYFFYHIFERLQRMQVEQLRLAASAKEAELRALKSQVNPHFLFNSLNSLRALIDEDAPRARESVTRLANMLRYSLQSGQLETVPFEDEVRIVEDYLALEQIRHESRLRVRWSIADDVRACGVPPMLLQTLAENAVKYGISARRDGGELVISAQLVEKELVIRVTNPGDLSQPASTAAAKAGSSTGVGLRNASERLKLLFGDRAQLSLTAEPAGFVTAEVRIPCLSRP